MVGAGAAVRLAPQLPPAWRSARFANLKFRGSVFDLAVDQTAGVVAARVVHRAGAPVPVELVLHLPAGAEPVSRRGGDRPTVGARTPRGTPVTFTARVDGEVRFEARYSGGFRVWAVHEPLALGDRSTRLRIIDATHDGTSARIKIQGLAGARYAVNLEAPARVRSLVGAREVGRDGRRAGASRWYCPPVNPSGLTVRFCSGSARL